MTPSAYSSYRSHGRWRTGQTARLYDDDLTLIPAGARRQRPLAKAGLWERVADYWLITVFEDTQTTRAMTLDALPPPAPPAGQDAPPRPPAERRSPGHVPGTVTRDSTRTGQARTGALRGTGEQRGSCAEPDCPRGSPFRLPNLLGPCLPRGGTVSSLPPDWPLIRQIVRIVYADPCGGIHREALAGKLHLPARGRSVSDALGIAYRNRKIDFCGQYVVKPVKIP